MSFPRLSICLTMPLVLAAALLTGACGAPLAVSAASYAADGGLLIVSDKTSTDHIASVVTKQDCAMWRILRGRRICKERDGDKDPYDVDYTEAQRSVSESGVQYGPPLRAAPDAPAASWDAAVYKTVPPAPASQGPMVADAEVSPEPAVEPAPKPAPAARAAPTSTAKVRKGKTARSVKKPSRGQVASAP
jgi:hypothetical protein